MCNRNIVALNRIKAIVDAYKEERIHITIGNDDFNDVTHTYDVSVIMAERRAGRIILIAAAPGVGQLSARGDGTG